MTRPAAERPLVRIAALGSLIAAAIIVILLVLGGGGGHHYRFLFETAGQLVNGNQVQIGGVVAGSVDKIERTDDNLALVEVTVEQELHKGTTAEIRQTSLSGIANRYVSISPGPNSEPVLEEGETLGLTLTGTPVDLDQVLNTFSPRVRKGLADFIQGNGAVYAGKGKEANRTYKYFAPALNRTEAVFGELNRDKVQFRRFLVSSSQLVTALASRQEELSSSVSNAREAFGAVATHADSLDRGLRALPKTLRQGNTTFVNLRDALDDIDPLVATAKTATKDLAPFLRRLRPTLRRSVPLFRNLSLTVKRARPANDARELVRALPKLHPRASTAFPSAIDAIQAFQPVLNFARPYMPELMGAVTKLGQITGYYDRNGHYARVSPSGSNFFSWDSLTNMLDPIPPSQQYDDFGPPAVRVLCPGGSTQSAPDSSNPFINPPWPESGLTAADCNPADQPPGP